MWFYSSTFYHIYPLGLCDAPRDNDGMLQNRIGRLEGWRDHLTSLGIGAVYFGPLFESDRHGYDTRDYRRLDCRLGANEDFKRLCRCYHDAGIRIVVDGVFNHVGRGFWAFQDVISQKQNSAYQDWFLLDFGRDSNYNDGFWYEGWEGHYELVKLNLRNEAVVSHLLDCVRGWIEEFGIDGLRLDVAYLLDRDFMRTLRRFTRELRPEFFLLGEIIHGDYRQLLSPELLDSCTNYECYKGLFSSFNALNLYEIGYSLNRQFGPEHWTLYKGEHLFSFLDNHDVSRIASVLTDKRHLQPAYALLFAMPGIPCIYYGSEWGEAASKEQGDDALRPAFMAPEQTELTGHLARLAELHRNLEPLWNGDYLQLIQTNRQLVFSREAGGKRVIVAINADDAPYEASFADIPPEAFEMISGKVMRLSGKLPMPACSAGYWTWDPVELRG